MGRGAVVRLRHVHVFSDRLGKPRAYLRLPGQKSVPLPGVPGSPEFMTAYYAAIAGFAIEPKAIGETRSAPGSVSAAIASYYTDNSFLVLSPGTRAMRRAILERFRAVHGQLTLAGMQQKHVAQILGKMKPFAARNWLKTLRGLMQFAVGIGLRANDPTDGIKPVKAKAGTRHSWTDEEIAQFEARHPLGGRERLAMALLFYTAARREDMVLFGPQHIRGGKLHYRQLKTGRQLEIPLYPQLVDVLAASAVGHLVFLTTAQGKPFTAAGFGNWFREVCDAADLPHCSAHGLRKARLRILAENGATANEIGAFGGHVTLSEVQRYTAAAEQARLAESAMKRTR